MTSAELDLLVRRVGDAFTAKLGGLPQPAPSCGCQHADAPEKPPAWTGLVAGAAGQFELSVRAAVTTVATATGVQAARNAGLAAVYVALGHVPAAERLLRGSPTVCGTQIGSLDAPGMAEVHLAAAAAAVRVGARHIDLLLSASSLNEGRLDEAYSEIKSVAAIVHGAGGRLRAGVASDGLDATALLRVAAIARLAGASGITLLGGGADQVSWLHRAVGGDLEIIASSTLTDAASASALFAAGATCVRSDSPFASPGPAR